MYRKFAAVVCCLAAAFTFCVGVTDASAAPSTGSPVSYYLALGDSLSRGYMPPAGNSDQGYVDDLYAKLHAANPALELVKLGCSGETTTSMIKGGICSYDGAASQLVAAENFLRAHHGAVRYMTIDIGANDIDGCASTGSIDIGCAVSGLGTIAGNTLQIMARLRLAGGGSPVIAAMSYYNPFLAAWLKGASGQTTAQLSSVFLNLLNVVQGAEYKLFGAKLVDVAGAFHSSDFGDPQTLPGFGSVPLNVATICQLTYMCTLGNIHANVAGYQLIADTFGKTLHVA